MCVCLFGFRDYAKSVTPQISCPLSVTPNCLCKICDLSEYLAHSTDHPDFLCIFSVPMTQGCNWPQKWGGGKRPKRWTFLSWEKKSHIFPKGGGHARPPGNYTTAPYPISSVWVNESSLKYHGNVLYLYYQTNIHYPPVSLDLCSSWEAYMHTVVTVTVSHGRSRSVMVGHGRADRFSVHSPLAITQL